MTQYRKVVRTTKGGSIKQHYDIDWIFYASIQIKGVWYSTITKTLEEAEKWCKDKKLSTLALYNDTNGSTKKSAKKLETKKSRQSKTIP